MCLCLCLCLIYFIYKIRRHVLLSMIYRWKRIREPQPSWMDASWIWYISYKEYDGMYYYFWYTDEKEYESLPTIVEWMPNESDTILSRVKSNGDQFHSINCPLYVWVWVYTVLGVPNLLYGCDATTISIFHHSPPFTVPYYYPHTEVTSLVVLVAVQRIIQTGQHCHPLEGSYRTSILSMHSSSSISNMIIYIYIYIYVAVSYDFCVFLK